MPNGLDISQFNIGVSHDGTVRYRLLLHTIVFVETVELINQYEPIVTAVEAGWQGASARAFLTEFEERREEIKGFLQRESDDIENRLLELETSYFRQDMEMMNR